MLGDGMKVQRIRNKTVLTRLTFNYLSSAVNTKLLEIDKTMQSLATLTGKENKLNDASLNYFKAQFEDLKAVKEEFLNFLRKIEVKDG